MGSDSDTPSTGLIWLLAKLLVEATPGNIISLTTSAVVVALVGTKVGTGGGWGATGDINEGKDSVTATVAEGGGNL
jgi:hypothetical protein